MIYKFVLWDVDLSEEAVHNSDLGKWHDTLQRGDKLSLTDYIALQVVLIHSGSSNGSIKMGGWCFDFSPFLKTYWVQTHEEDDYGNVYNTRISEGYFFDEKHLREFVKYHGLFLDKMVEV